MKLLQKEFFTEAHSYDEESDISNKTLEKMQGFIETQKGITIVNISQKTYGNGVEYVLYYTMPEAQQKRRTKSTIAKRGSIKRGSIEKAATIENSGHSAPLNE